MDTVTPASSYIWSLGKTQTYVKYLVEFGPVVHHLTFLFILIKYIICKIHDLTF